jgi:hypothetical protein
MPQLRQLIAGFSLQWPRFEPRSGHAETCGGQNDTGARFLRTLQFPLPLIPPNAPQSSSSYTGAGTIGQIVVDIPNGLSHPIPPQVEKRYKLLLQTKSI